ncbi:MAG: type II secretion system F family protein [bacterium]
MLGALAAGADVIAAARGASLGAIMGALTAREAPGKTAVKSPKEKMGKMTAVARAASKGAVKGALAVKREKAAGKEAAPAAPAPETREKAQEKPAPAAKTPSAPAASPETASSSEPDIVTAAASGASQGAILGAHSSGGDVSSAARAASAGAVEGTRSSGGDAGAAARGSSQGAILGAISAGADVGAASQGSSQGAIEGAKSSGADLGLAAQSASRGAAEGASASGANVNSVVRSSMAGIYRGAQATGADVGSVSRSASLGFLSGGGGKVSNQQVKAAMDMAMNDILGGAKGSGKEGSVVGQSLLEGILKKIFASSEEDDDSPSKLKAIGDYLGGNVSSILDSPFLLPMLLFGMVISLGLPLVNAIAPAEGLTSSRLRSLSGEGDEDGAGESADAKGKKAKTSLQRLILKIGGSARSLFEGGGDDTVHRLAMAGFNSPDHIARFHGSRLTLAAGLAFAGSAAALVLGQPVVKMILFAAVGLLAGMVLPTFWLGRRISSRREKISASLPNMVDLLVVCVEAGLGIDAAMSRVGAELQISAPELGQELTILGRELSAGQSHEQAFTRLSWRIGIDDVENLTSMLTQAERFGTSIAVSLRVFSDSYRTARRQRIEEAAAKTTVKLLFPLVFFIFPSIFAILLGPAVVNIATGGLK